jgi:hypothetical protein
MEPNYRFLKYVSENNNKRWLAAALEYVIISSPPVQEFVPLSGDCTRCKLSRDLSNYVDLPHFEG